MGAAPTLESALHQSLMSTVETASQDSCLILTTVVQLQSVLVRNDTIECIRKFPRILFQSCDTVQLNQRMIHVWKMMKRKRVAPVKVRVTPPHPGVRVGVEVRVGVKLGVRGGPNHLDVTQLRLAVNARTTKAGHQRRARAPAAVEAPVLVL